MDHQHGGIVWPIIAGFILPLKMLLVIGWGHLRPFPEHDPSMIILKKFGGHIL